MNIAVYGFMGVGKTTIGEVLAERLGYNFIDMDAEIEHIEGTKISTIFKEKGEPYFRKLESELVQTLSNSDKQVIACGGGTVAYPENAETLSASTRMVYLTASIEEIINRTKDDSSRPLLDVDDPRNTALLLLEKRKPIYERYAEVTIDTTGLSPNVVVEKILEAL
ncbi:MAG: shikimate kinase [Candidatus Bathyarchaeota archaeon]|nr:shikimate kinase [Candidatus Bathyarchaeota archaeon]